MQFQTGSTRVSNSTTEKFDAYRKWLGVSSEARPPDHYSLLGIPAFEDDPDVIDNAAARQMAHVRTFQHGKHTALSQKILNELSAAKICLLNPRQKTAYDEQLRDALEVAAPAPPAPPAATPPAPAPPAPARPQRAASTLPSGPAAPRRAAAKKPPQEQTNAFAVDSGGSGGRPVSMRSSARVRRKKSSPLPIVLSLVGVAVFVIVVGLALNSLDSSGKSTGDRRSKKDVANSAPEKEAQGLPEPGNGLTEQGIQNQDQTPNQNPDADPDQNDESNTPSGSKPTNVQPTSDGSFPPPGGNDPANANGSSLPPPGGEPTEPSNPDGGTEVARTKPSLPKPPPPSTAGWLSHERRSACCDR